MSNDLTVTDNKSNLNAKQKQQIKLPNKRIRHAIELMCTQGMTRPQAAETAGIKDNSLYKALRRPDVVRYKTQVLRAFREAETERAYVKIVDISDTAASEHVKLDANKTLLSLDDRYISATKQVHSGTVEHVVTPGYVIDLSEDEGEQLNTNQVIEAEVIQEDQ